MPQDDLRLDTDPWIHYTTCKTRAIGTDYSISFAAQSLSFAEEAETGRPVLLVVDF